MFKLLTLSSAFKGKAALGPFFPWLCPFHMKAETAVCLLGCFPALSVMNLRQVAWYQDVSYLYALCDCFFYAYVGVQFNNIPHLPPQSKNPPPPWPKAAIWNWTRGKARSRWNTLTRKGRVLISFLKNNKVWFWWPFKTKLEILSLFPVSIKPEGYV